MKNAKAEYERKLASIQLRMRAKLLRLIDGTIWNPHAIERIEIYPESEESAGDSKAWNVAIYAIGKPDDEPIDVHPCENEKEAREVLSEFAAKWELALDNF
ncbi:MAG: hypothetical protein DMF62_03040 [Acidobacteria bacterium]|nr:MAG: hypothetical protein DMF62_03040 [Acidobacteriota bacterium]